MTKGIFALGLILWLGVFALAGKWVAAPWIWSNALQSPSDLKTIELAAKKFPVRLARLPGQSISQRMSLVSEDEEMVAVDVNAQHWAYRETRNRFVLVFAAWLASGLLVHWFVGRTLRDQEPVACLPDAPHHPDPN